MGISQSLYGLIYKGLFGITFDRKHILYVVCVFCALLLAELRKHPCLAAQEKEYGIEK